jgi:hypothetical protein
MIYITLQWQNKNGKTAAALARQFGVPQALREGKAIPRTGTFLKVKAGQGIVHTIKLSNCRPKKPCTTGPYGLQYR